MAIQKTEKSVGTADLLSVQQPETKKRQSKTKTGLQAQVFDTAGREIETIELPKSMFAATVSEALLAQYVRVYLTNKRRGNASAKTRAQVVGSTRKIWRQKGTGRARHGAKKAPIFVGGGVAHGPSGKVFSLTINKKQKRKALFSALTQKFRAHEISFVKGLLEVTPKTKEMVSILKNFEVSDRTSVLLTFPKDKSRSMVLASRNLEKVHLKDVQSLNAYDLLLAKKIIFATEGLPVFIAHYER